MNIKETHKKVIDDLVKGIRPQLVLDDTDIKSLREELESSHSKKDYIPILCILDNSRTLSFDLTKAF